MVVFGGGDDMEKRAQGMAGGKISKNVTFKNEIKSGYAVAVG